MQNTKTFIGVLAQVTDRRTEMQLEVYRVDAEDQDAAIRRFKELLPIDECPDMYEFRVFDIDFKEVCPAYTDEQATAYFLQDIEHIFK